MILTLSAANAAYSAEIEPLESIRGAVEHFLQSESDSLGANVEVTVGHLDTRLRLSRCDSPLQVSWPASARKQGNVTVVVSCDAPTTWSLYVQGKVQVFEKIIVSSRSMSRGEVLSEHDVALADQDLAALNGGYYTRPDEVAGMVLKRSIKAGMILTPSLVKPQRLIRRGDKVTILAETGAVQVRMEGQALMEGAKGEVIRVRNLSSRLEIEAEVVSPGVVRVRM